ncbi:short chain dehydrogenase reductase [Nemania sp. FL0916]|nr:short chain dehydrogenase reductase [Nemania sp. FL0916]
MSFDTLSLVGKTALITGSGRETGIGAAIAKALARHGASVAVHYVSEGSKSGAQKIAADISTEYGSKTTVVQGPVNNASSAKRIVEGALKGLEVNHIDILVNNAGGASTVQNTLEIEQEHFDREFGVNVFGVVYMAQAVVDVGKMPKGGRIVNVGSVASKMSTVGTSLYNAAKSAQDSLTAGLASDLGRTHGITVNTLAPGPIPTDSSRPYLINPDGTPNPIGTNMAALSRAAERLGTVEDMADATLLLVSEKSRWITAQWISVSGGVTATM